MLTCNADGVAIGYVWVRFTSPIQYSIEHCTSTVYWINFPVQPPYEVDKIWTIRKTDTALIMECNEVEVLNFQFSDSSEWYCEDYWGGDVVKKIKFQEYYSFGIRYIDTASDSYRAKLAGNAGVL